jgi:ribosomal protein S12 methylthiotransferase
MVVDTAYLGISTKVDLGRARTPTYWIETLGCPKNVVDSAKLSGLVEGLGYELTAEPESADVIIVNTCAFIEAARTESIETMLDLAERRRSPDTKIVVTGCMAERYGEELSAALPEIDLVAGFGELPLVRDQIELLGSGSASSFDLLRLPRPRATSSWAYLKVAEGCDRRCGFCAIPSFRGDQSSRSIAELVDEAAGLARDGVKEIVLVAQDLASFGRDRRRGGSVLDAELDAPQHQALIGLVEQVSGLVPWVRLLYLYPSGLTDGLIDAVLSTGVPYFDLSLQHASRPLLRSMRRWGSGDRFLSRIDRIRELEPSATFRSSFIVGYPGETEDDQRALVGFLEAAELDWAGFFPFSREEGTAANELPDQVDGSLALERLAECTEVQDAITRRARQAMVGQTHTVLIDHRGRGRSVHEAPEIDGVFEVPEELEQGTFHRVVVERSLGTDLVAAVA